MKTADTMPNPHDYSRIIVLTGAGISAESGLKTFRDNNGLWEDHSVEEVATPEAFQANPDLVYRFYNQRRAQLQKSEVLPNAGHVALADFEKQFTGEFLLVTQNVDNLHERAGSNNIRHMHGELLSARCCQSGVDFTISTDFDAQSRCTCCQPPQTIRPNIVWFGEIPMHMDEIYQSLSQTDLFISIGTSGNVYPAAGFVEQAKAYSAYCIELNLEQSLSNSHFDQGFYGAASQIVPMFFRQGMR